MNWWSLRLKRGTIELSFLVPRGNLVSLDETATGCSVSRSGMASRPSWIAKVVLAAEITEQTLIFLDLPSIQRRKRLECVSAIRDRLREAPRPVTSARSGDRQARSSSHGIAVRFRAGVSHARTRIGDLGRSGPRIRSVGVDRWIRHAISSSRRETDLKCRKTLPGPTSDHARSSILRHRSPWRSQRCIIAVCPLLED